MGGEDNNSFALRSISIVLRILVSVQIIAIQLADDKINAETAVVWLWRYQSFLLPRSDVASQAHRISSFGQVIWR